ncbi:hypothetical protein K438DRAFT_2150845 [Mycena galopus ATCC 62051]|nr:hypothetical protein K438DRAFT_2150845 [Mycena galopus ATCC 62051]
MRAKENYGWTERRRVHSALFWAPSATERDNRGYEKRPQRSQADMPRLFVYMCENAFERPGRTLISLEEWSPAAERMGREDRLRSRSGHNGIGLERNVRPELNRMEKMTGERNGDEVEEHFWKALSCVPEGGGESKIRKETRWGGHETKRTKVHSAYTRDDKNKGRTGPSESRASALAHSRGRNITCRLRLGFRDTTIDTADGYIAGIGAGST